MALPVPSATFGRNERCPCGSGRKYKHCCMGGPASPPRPSRSRFEEALELEARGRIEEATRAYLDAINVQPESAEAHVNLGNLQQRAGRFDAALASFRRALALRPQFSEVCLNLGALLQDMGRHVQAIESYRDALVHRPEDGRLHNNLALALRTCGEFDEAERHLRRAIDLGLPGSDPVHALGDVLLDQGRWKEAMQAYRRALALGPTSRASWSSLLMNLLYADDVTQEEIGAEHRRFGAGLEAASVPTIKRAPRLRKPGSRWKIGYVSPDLRSHSVAYFLEPVLANHDRDRFSIHCYDTGPREDPVTLRLRSMAEHWICGAGLSDDELERRIRADGIDLLVDLSGHTLGNRLGVFARRPAPVQVSWIGYPEGTGLSAIDYRISDCSASPEVGAPPGDAPGGALFRLPRVFSCYRPPAFSPEVAARTDPTISAVTLGSFNNSAKISDFTVRLWSKVLAANPSLRLLLKDRRFAHSSCCANIRQRFSREGVDPSRIDLLHRMESAAEHLAAYGGVDVALDTYPYCGATTTCEALWMGVPVVSMAGVTFVSRMGASLLGAAGHPEWIAGDEDAFVRCVLSLAADTALRTHVRTSLRGQMRTSPLMDEAAFTRDLESAYERMCGLILT